MKRIALVFLLAGAVLSAKAQDLYVSGNFSFWHNDDADYTTLTIAPEVGYNLTDKWAVGFLMDFTHFKGGGKVNSFSLAPYARYTYYENKVVRLFIDGGFGFATVKEKGEDADSGFEIGVKPGIAIKISDRFSLVSRIGFLGYRDDYGIDPFSDVNLGKWTQASGFGLSLRSTDLTIGFQVNF